MDVDSHCYVDFAFEDVDVCDFIVVKESVGHPATFDFRLVSIHSLHDHPTNFNIKNGLRPMLELCQS